MSTNWENVQIACLYIIITKYFVNQENT